MIVLLMAEGDLFLFFPAKGFLICVLVCGGGVPHGISVRTALQSAAKPDQIVRRTTMPTSVPSKIRAS